MQITLFGGCVTSWKNAEGKEGEPCCCCSLPCCCRGSSLFAAGCWLLAAGCWLLLFATGCCPAAVPCYCRFRGGRHGTQRSVVTVGGGLVWAAAGAGALHHTVQLACVSRKLG